MRVDIEFDAKMQDRNYCKSEYYNEKECHSVFFYQKF